MFEDVKIWGVDAGLDFELKLDPGKRVYCFIGENGCGKTVLMESLAQICLFGHVMWRNSPKQGTFQGLYAKNKLREIIKDRVLHVPHAAINGKTIKTEQNWNFIELIKSIPMLSSPFTIENPILFVSSHQRTTINNIETALSLVGNTTEVFSNKIKNTIKYAVCGFSAWEKLSMLRGAQFCPPAEQIR
jgi:ABC-type cobalamin/Fe3+-siderophores transport system ATPase subunit